MQDKEFKTILINIFDRAVYQNIFVSGFVETLKASKLSVVVVVSSNKYDEFSSLLKPSGFTIVKRPKLDPSVLELFSLFFARNSIPTHAVRQIQETGFDGSGRPPFFLYILSRIFWVVGKLRILTRIILKILEGFFHEEIFEDISNTYKPDLIFTPTIYSLDDVRLMRHAKKKGIKIVGMIKSWDNLTSKDPMFIKPDWLIVQNNLEKEEAIRMHNYPESNIFVSGLPQYDRFVNLPETRREDFFQRIGLDPNKKLIVYTAMGTWLAFHENDTIKLLSRFYKENLFSEPSQILVRLHPAYITEGEDISGLEGVTVDRPGTAKFASTALKGDWKFEQKDFIHLIDTLRYADVVINSGSTTIIDSAILDTPIVCVGFDAYHPKESYWKSAERLMKRDHCIPIVESGGVAMVDNKEGLIVAINDYFKNPDLKKEGRKQIVDEECFKIDGKSGKRLASFLNDLVV